MVEFYHTEDAYLYKKEKFRNYARRVLPVNYKKYILKIEAEQTEEKKNEK